MRILALDIGTGTQDILLFDSAQTPENCIKLVMPSPTAVVARRLSEATHRGSSLLLTGVIMGGGPSGRAMRRHVESGLRLYATPEPARTLDDDLHEVERLGVTVVSEDEAAALHVDERVELRDLDLDAVRTALHAFGAEAAWDGVAVAVLDHGAAPPGVSDRVFRFDYLRSVVERDPHLSAFFYLAQEVPEQLTRMRAVAASHEVSQPLLLADTGVAAAVGASDDPEVDRHEHRVAANLGNAHTLAFHLGGSEVLGLFEHHTGALDTARLDEIIESLIAGSLTFEQVFEEGGHGAYVLQRAETVPFVAVTGPRRALAAASAHTPYMAVPHGDMMITGCFGLVRGFAHKMRAWQEEIEAALA